MITVSERRNKVSLSTLNQGRNLTLKQRWFWVDSKKAILFINHDVWKITNLYINIKNMTVFQRRNNVSLSTLNERRKLTSKQRWFWVDSKKPLSLMIIQYLRTITLNDICSDLICLQAVVFSWYFMKVSRKWSKEASIFNKLQVYENIYESFYFSITLKDDFCDHVILEIYSLVESCFMEIRGLLPVTLQKKLLQVRFLDISRTNIINILTVFSKSFILDVLLLNRTSKINVVAKIVFLNILNVFSKRFILDVLLSSEFFSALQ